MAPSFPKWTVSATLRFSTATFIVGCVRSKSAGQPKYNVYYGPEGLTFPKHVPLPRKQQIKLELEQRQKHAADIADGRVPSRRNLRLSNQSNTFASSHKSSSARSSLTSNAEAWSSTVSLRQHRLRMRAFIIIIIITDKTSKCFTNVFTKSTALATGIQVIDSGRSIFSWANGARSTASRRAWSSCRGWIRENDASDAGWRQGACDLVMCLHGWYFVVFRKIDMVLANKY